MDGKTILVTGGAGFIGSHLTRFLTNENTVRVLDIEPNPKLPENVTYIQGDVRDEETVSQAAADVDIIFHEAALVSVAESLKHPTTSHTTNATGTLHVLEAARAHDARVVFASSAAVYGHPEYTPLDESHPTAPTSPYGLDKLTADRYVRFYADQYNVETVPLRYFNVYGPGQTGGDYAGVITVFINQALNDDPITVHGDGSQTRDFVFVEDVIQANLLAATTAEAGRPYNIGTGQSITIRRLAERIQDLADSQADIVHTDPRDGDISDSRADITAARETLGYEPTISLREGLERTIDWYRTQS